MEPVFDSRHIRTFHEVVRAGSYSAAARELGYTQPAITQQMKALERSVGLPLFTRAGRGLRLTEAGEALSGTPSRSSAASPPPSSSWPHWRGCAPDASGSARSRAPTPP